jgi:hypothetical protein
MPALPKRIKTYKELVEFILREHKDMINLDRLNMFMAKARRKYRIVKDIDISEDYKLDLPETITDDEEEGLKNLSSVIGCAFKVLEMFLGSNTAKDRIVDSVEKFQSLHPDMEGLDLERYLPRREEEEDEEGDTEDDTPKDDIMEMEDLTDKDDDEAPEDILKPKEEGIPHYDEEKKKWVLVPAHLVKKVKEDASEIEPVFEESALKRKKIFKKAVKKTKDKDGAKPVDQGDPYMWLQEEFHSKATYFVEGTGQEKNMLCAEFVKEGLEAGEDVIVILGYPPKIFLSQMYKIGAVEKDLDGIHIIDWHTFKEKQVIDVETDGNTHIVPKDPKFMGSVLTKILGKLDKATKKRAFVSVVSYALAFIDFETIYNFVQITRLKFRKSNVSALFTIEAGQHDRDVRSSFREVSDGWIRIREGMSGANTWKMKAEVNAFEEGSKTMKDVVIMRDGIVVLDRKVAKIKEEGIEDEGAIEKDKAPAVAKKKIEDYLVDKIEMWKGLGFSVDKLEEKLEEGEKAFKKALTSFEKRAGKALEMRGRLDEIATRLEQVRDTSKDDEIIELRSNIRDLKELKKVDERITALENRLSRKLEKEGRRRDREKEIFRIRLEHWARQGYDTSRLEKIMDKDLEKVNKEFAAFRSIVNKLKRIEEDLSKMDHRGHEDEVREIRERLFDVNGIERTEELFNKVKQGVMVKERIKETAKTRRNELMDEIFNWALEGYCVDLIDQIDIFREELGDLESRLGKIRQTIERLKKMEVLLNTLDLTHHRKEEMAIRSMIKDVDQVDEVERRVMALQEKVGDRVSGEVMALDANMERVKELEETWKKLKARLLAEKSGKDTSDEKE